MSTCFIQIIKCLYNNAPPLSAFTTGERVRNRTPPTERVPRVRRRPKGLKTNPRRLARARTILITKENISIVMNKDIGREITHYTLMR